jgi:hypothetical protein
MKTSAQRLAKFYWWINERHRIYLNKLAEKDWPWTKDEIMQEYKFTNVFRELDAETVKFHKRIDSFNGSQEDKLFHMIAYRAFNVQSTYDLLTRGAKTLGNAKKMKAILHKAADRGEKVFTGAYIITNAGRTEPKIDLMCDALCVMFRGRNKIYEEMMNDGTMQGCTKILLAYPMQGPFTSYEVICDMRYQKGMLWNAPDRKKWANLGPGARRGINRIVTGNSKKNAFFGAHSADRYVEFMQEMLKTSPKYRGKHVPSLEMREIEHSLCEFDKYVRVLNGEGRPRAKYKRRK